MTTVPFVINTQEELYKLSEAASKENYPIYISTDYGMLDAKSILALFTILGKEIKLVAPDHANAGEFVKFVENLEQL